MDAKEWIKARPRLSGELIHALHNSRRPGSNLDNLYCHFFTKRGRLICDGIAVADALDYLHNDVYHFHEFDLRLAAKLEVHAH